MHRNGSGKQDEEESESPMLSYKYGAVYQRDPYKTDRNDLDPQRDGLVLHEIADIWS